MQKTPSEHLGVTSFGWDDPRYVWPAKNYREMVDLPFMGGIIKAPVEWDACLKQQFGDYMVFQKGTSLHTEVLFDLDVPYTEKLKNNHGE